MTDVSITQVDVIFRSHHLLDSKDDFRLGCRNVSQQGPSDRSTTFSNLVLMLSIITFHTNLVPIVFLSTESNREEWGLWEHNWIEIRKSYLYSISNSDLKVPNSKIYTSHWCPWVQTIYWVRKKIVQNEFPNLSCDPSSILLVRLQWWRQRVIKANSPPSCHVIKWRQ